jgi:hypothetical protein
VAVRSAQRDRDRGDREFEEQLLGASGAEQSLLSRYLPRFLSRTGGRMMTPGGTQIPQQLLDLGVSPALCVRALQEGSNDG